MCSQLAESAADMRRPGLVSTIKSVFPRILIALLCAAATACSSPPPAALGLDAADSGSRALSLSYRPVTSGYTSARPAEPATWGEDKNNAAPPAKQ